MASREEAYRSAEDGADPAALTSRAWRLGGERHPKGAEAAPGAADHRVDAAAAFNLGGLLTERGDLAAAVAAFRLADERGHGAGASDLGLLLEQQGDLEGAEAAYRRADARGHAAGAYNLGALLAERGDLAGAVAAFRRADQGGHGAGASNLGLLLEQQGDLEGAEAAYRRADARGHPAGAYNLGALLAERGDLAGAEAALRRAVADTDPDGARMAREALLSLGLSIDDHVTERDADRPTALSGLNPAGTMGAVGAGIPSGTGAHRNGRLDYSEAARKAPAVGSRIRRAANRETHAGSGHAGNAASPLLRPRMLFGLGALMIALGIGGLAETKADVKPHAPSSRVTSPGGHQRPGSSSAQPGIAHRGSRAGG